MENERVIIATDKKTLKEVLSELMFQEKKDSSPEISEEKLTKVQARKLIGISQPTLDKLIKKGKFIEHSLGTKKYLLKSEVIESLKQA